MVEASLIILHRNPFYLFSFFFLYSFANSGQNSDCDKTNLSFRLQCTHYMYTRVAISATSLSSRFIEWKNCKAFSDPSENRSACSLYSWHYMYLNSSLYLYTEIFNFSSYIWISIFNESSKKKNTFHWSFTILLQFKILCWLNKILTNKYTNYVTATLSNYFLLHYGTPLLLLFEKYIHSLWMVEATF